MKIEELRQEAAISIGIAKRIGDKVYLINAAKAATTIGGSLVGLMSPALNFAAQVLGQGISQDTIIREFKGTVDDYRRLPAADQIALTDRMAKLIASNPAQFTPEQVKVSQDRVNSTQFEQPLAATSYINVTGELIKTGELQQAMISGAKTYFQGVTALALAGGVVFLLVLMAKNERN